MPGTGVFQKCEISCKHLQPFLLWKKLYNTLYYDNVFCFLRTENKKERKKTQKGSPHSLWQERVVLCTLQIPLVSGIFSPITGRSLRVPGGAPNGAHLERGLEAGFARVAFMPSLLLQRHSPHHAGCRLEVKMPQIPQ